jgi:hypothetical protein
MALVLYELGGRNDARYSLFSWRTRLALAHKGLSAELRPVRVSDKAAIGFSGQGKVPILVDGERVVVDVDGSVRVSDGAEVADGALVLRGTAVELLEVLSIRAPMTFEVPPDQRWLVAGLAEVFETDGGAASRDPAPA